MGYTQAVTPNPNIPCRPGWCLQYVRQAFGLPAIHPTATAAWEASKTQHRDRNFPAGVWHPVWYGLSKEPAGHVVLRAPNGNVYSTSDLSNTPHLHPDLADLERYYARYGMTLTYRGWTEDVQGITVINNFGLAAQGATTTPKGFLMALTDEQQDRLFLLVDRYLDAPVSAVPEKVWSQTVTRGGRQISVKQELADSKSLAEKAAGTLAAQVAVAKGAGLTAEQITAAVKAALSDATVTVDFSVEGAK